MRRVVAATLSLGLASVAVAQDGDRVFEAGRIADLQNWEWRARQGVAPSEAEKAAQAVVEAIAARDCSAAASRLNAGLAKGYPELLILGGAMLEEGVCLKPNWDRAVSLYEKAAAAGRKDAVARIAAGYAAPAGGRDMAAALWWALRAGTPLPSACTQVASLVADADKFVAALKAWPAAQFNACVYSAAVMSSIHAEAAWPGYGGAYGLQGQVRFVFVPERGQVDIVEDVAAMPSRTGIVADAATRERDLRAARTAFSASLRQLADRALKRYDKPGGVPAGWRVEAQYAFASAP